jgi:hypothetical protein
LNVISSWHQNLGALRRQATTKLQTYTAVNHSLGHAAGKETLAAFVSVPLIGHCLATTNGTAVLKLAPASIKPSFPDNISATHGTSLG